MVFSKFVRENAVSSTSSAGFRQAVLVFRDGSQLQFEHSSRQNRWARASSPDSMANTVALALAQFRLNATHLELFFKDGSTLELKPGDDTERQESNGASLGQT